MSTHQQKNTPRGWQITLTSTGAITITKVAVPGSAGTFGATTLNVSLEDARELVAHLLQIVT